MGQHEYKSLPVGNPLEMDFTAVTRKLNHIGKRVSVDILNLEFLKLSLDAVETWRMEINSVREAPLEEIDGLARTTMKEKTRLMREDCRSLVLLAQYEEKRVRNLIQAVCFPSYLKGLQPTGLNRSISSRHRKMPKSILSLP